MKEVLVEVKKVVDMWEVFVGVVFVYDGKIIVWGYNLYV